MSNRHFPVHPNLRQLKNQAKDLLRAIRRGDPDAIGDLREHHPKRPDAAEATLADAQLALARSYGLASWPRLVLACEVTDAICHDRVARLRELMIKHPRLLTESARGTVGENWGPPMSYAANLGRTRIIEMLRQLGATDLDHAFNRACLQGELDAARQLYGMGARPARDALMGPAETLGSDGMAFLLELGADVHYVSDDGGTPAALVIETYVRGPQGKHACLELLVRYGFSLPDTPTMALHRGRIDLLEQHLRRDPDLLARTFSHTEIYPPSIGCHADQSLALNTRPLGGATLLHLAADYDEMAIARGLLAHGMDVNARAPVDANGFGGHTALFACVVAQSFRMRKTDDFAALLLDHGADPNIRVSLRKQMRFVGDELMHEYRDVTPLSWGARFHDRDFVSEKAMRLVEKRGGRR
jgi:ankyrin repeat protein